MIAASVSPSDAMEAAGWIAAAVALVVVLALAVMAGLGLGSSSDDEPRPGSDAQWTEFPGAITEAQAYAQGAALAEHARPIEEEVPHAEADPH